MTSIGLRQIINSIGTFKLKAIKLFDLVVGTLLASVVKPKTATKDIPNPIKTILIIRPGGIGDAVFLLPILHALRKNNPGIQVDILCEKRNVQVFKSQQNICHAIFCYDNFVEFKELWNKSYDVVIDTEQWHYLSALVAYFLPAQITIGFSSRPLRKKLFNQALSYDTEAYELLNFRNLFLPFLPDANTIHTIQGCFTISSEAVAWAGGEMPPQATRIALFLGASIPAKRLDISQNLELIKSILQRNSTDIIILLGGNDVKKDSEEICQHFNTPRILNYIGKASLQQTAALIKTSQVFIGPDSGVTHLASAVGTPVVAIFGPSDPRKWGPRGPQDKLVSLNVECSPCSLYGYTVPTCHGSYKCLRKISVQEILSLLPLNV